MYYDRDVEPGRVYAYRVEAFDADAASAPSEPRTIAIAGTELREQLAPPSGLTVETALLRQGDRDLRAARLRWQAPASWDCRGYVATVAAPRRND